MYLKLGLIKQYGASGRNVFLMLRLTRKKKKRKKGCISTHMELAAGKPHK